MKKSVLFGLLSVLFVFASCKSKENAYKQAYEAAKAQENTQVQVNTPVKVTPVATVNSTSDYDSAPVRQEQVSVVSVSGELKAYSVVCGSFSLQANAQGLKDFLIGEGYKAGIVKNVEKNMFRVIIGSYDTKADAARAREAFKVKYPSRADFQGSWILLNK
ncbi:MAG: SPOR domain-containing protein [Bacteroidaceae bacterium]|jgi:cell division protein FtsN|nr:SPOR domain-containing protein [Bacteroidaceae bacterium]